VAGVRLIACPDCHRQFDVTHVSGAEIRCACGTAVPNEAYPAVQARVRRCGSCGAGVLPDAEACEYCRAAIVRDEGSLSLICPECYARNAEASRFCTACGIAFDPNPVAAGGQELPCVDCGSLMPPRAVGGIAVNECPGCHGLWVPGEQFEQLVGRAVDAARKAGEGGLPGRPARRAGANPASQPVRYRKCPVCEAYMQRRNYRKCSGVILDCCHAHGTWLDADELEEIAGFILERGGLPPEPKLEPRPAAPPTRFTREYRYGSLHDSAEGSLGRSVLGLLAALLD
jgi:Zn-finger nucleic acid-binding protein